MRRLGVGQSESWSGVAQGAKLDRRGVLRVVARTHASGRHRVSVRAYYGALRLVSSLDAGRVKAAKSAGSVGFDYPRPSPEART